MKSDLLLLLDFAYYNVRQLMKYKTVAPKPHRIIGIFSSIKEFRWWERGFEEY